MKKERGQKEKKEMRLDKSNCEVRRKGRKGNKLREIKATVNEENK